MTSSYTRPIPRSELTLGQQVVKLQERVAILEGALLLLMEKAGFEIPPPDLGVSVSEDVVSADIFGPQG